MSSARKRDRTVSKRGIPIVIAGKEFLVTEDVMNAIKKEGLDPEGLAKIRRLDATYMDTDQFHVLPRIRCYTCGKVIRGVSSSRKVDGEEDLPLFTALELAGVNKGKAARILGYTRTCCMYSISNPLTIARESEVLRGKLEERHKKLFPATKWETTKLPSILAVDKVTKRAKTEVGDLTESVKTLDLKDKPTPPRAIKAPSIKLDLTEVPETSISHRKPVIKKLTSAKAPTLNLSLDEDTGMEDVEDFELPEIKDDVEEVEDVDIEPEDIEAETTSKIVLPATPIVTNPGDLIERVDKYARIYRRAV